MIAAKPVEIRDNFKDYCEKVADGETVIIARKGNRNVVLLSEQEYNHMLQVMRNAEFLKKIDTSLEQIAQGKTVTKTMKDLEDME